jgi:hypothetical protein
MLIAARAGYVTANPRDPDASIAVRLFGPTTRRRRRYRTRLLGQLALQILPLVDG